MRARGLAAQWNSNLNPETDIFPFPLWLGELSLFPPAHSPNLLSNFSLAYRYYCDINILIGFSVKGCRVVPTSHNIGCTMLQKRFVCTGAMLRVFWMVARIQAEMIPDEPGPSQASVDEPI